jgi:tight adherence protein B
MVGVLALSWRCAPRAPRDRSHVAARRCTEPTDWAEFADAMGRASRAGDSLRGAFERVLAERAPRGDVVHPGANLDDVLSAPSAGADELVVVRAIQTAWKLGGPPSSGLHAAAALVRERTALRAEAEAHSAQARASARVLTMVPALFAVSGAATSASYRAVVATGAGLATTVAGVALNLVGWWWMRRLVREAAT